MGFVLLFIYFNYMRQTGYHISVMDWVILFIVGILQILAWTVRTGILSHRILPSDETGGKRLDEWFRN